MEGVQTLPAQDFCWYVKQSSIDHWSHLILELLYSLVCGMWRTIRDGEAGKHGDHGCRFFIRTVVDAASACTLACQNVGTCVSSVMLEISAPAWHRWCEMISPMLQAMCQCYRCYRSHHLSPCFASVDHWSLAASRPFDRKRMRDHLLNVWSLELLCELLRNC